MFATVLSIYGILTIIENIVLFTDLVDLVFLICSLFIHLRPEILQISKKKKDLIRNISSVCPSPPKYTIIICCTECIFLDLFLSISVWTIWPTTISSFQKRTAPRVHHRDPYDLNNKAFGIIWRGLCTIEIHTIVSYFFLYIYRYIYSCILWRGVLQSYIAIDNLTCKSKTLTPNPSTKFYSYNSRT